MTVDREETPAFVELQRNVYETIKRGEAEGLVRRSIYLRPEHFELVPTIFAVEGWFGMPLKRVSGKGRSVVYFQHGIARSIRTPQSLQSRHPAEKGRK